MVIRYLNGKLFHPKEDSLAGYVAQSERVVVVEIGAMVIQILASTGIKGKTVGQGTVRSGREDSY